MDRQRSGFETQQRPSHHTYRRVSADGIEVDELENLAPEHHRHCGKAGYQVVVCMDGKRLRGMIDLEMNDGLSLLAMFLPGERITLAQFAVECQQNEITVAPPLLSYVNLRNKVVIGDTLHTQRQVSIQIGAAGGNHLWTVKGNQPQLLQDLQDWFDLTIERLPGRGCLPKDLPSASVTSKGHGRLEVCTLTTNSQLNDFLDWPFLQRVFKLNGLSKL